MTFSEKEVENEAAASDEQGEKSQEAGDDAAGEVAAEAQGETTDADILSALGESGDASVEGAAEVGPKAEPEQRLKRIWSVQQIYALKAGRVDLQPTFGVSMNDPYVQHMAVSLAASYYITEVLAAGVSFNFYHWLNAETNLNFILERATHQAVPINEYSWGGQLNFTYVPMYGKFAMFREWIYHWDVWIIGGGGFIFTRPIPNIDPDYRDFDWDMKFCFNVGIGGRLFLNRFLAISLELRDYIFPEKLEALTAPTTPEERANKDNWLEDGYKLTNNVMLHAGVTIFIPFLVEYELPK